MALQNDYHLTVLISKFYRIGKQKYNGKVYDNVLNIFEELGIEEQKALLRGTLGVYVAATSAIAHERDVIDHGDVDALLAHLHRAKLEGDADTSTKPAVRPTVDRGPKKEPPIESTFARQGLGAAVLIVIGIIIYTSLEVSKLALDDDPEAIAKAKIYRNLYDVLMILFGS